MDKTAIIKGRKLLKVYIIMKLHLIFVSDKFIYNEILQEYVMRSITKKLGNVDSIQFIKQSDNALFLYLEEAFNKKENNVIVVTTKQHFTTVGKVIVTVTEDNQVLKNGILLPSKAKQFYEDSYLLEYKDTKINVMHIDEGERLPHLFLEKPQESATVHIFEEEQELLETLLLPIAQSYNVSFTLTKIVEGWLRVDARSQKYGELDNFLTSLKKLLPKKMVASASVVAYMIEKLAQQGKKISFAESCTGGLLSYFFTKHNGASQVLDGSLVTYSNALKENWLAVLEETLVNHGAVSAEVVREMSEGVLSVSGAHYAISISGIAGDSGGTEEKPVGTVYIGVRSENAHQEQRCFFRGDRNYIQQQSALYAIKMVILLDKESFF